MLAVRFHFFPRAVALRRSPHLGPVGLLALVLLTAACGSEGRDGPADATDAQVAVAAEPSPEASLDEHAYDSSMCGRIDPAPYADILGVEVPPLEVTTDSPRLFRCRARTDDLLVTVQFRADPSYWDGIAERLGPRLDVGPLEAYPGSETSGNLMVVRLERPWSAVVLAATRERPDPSDAQLEAVLRGLAELGDGP